MGYENCNNIVTNGNIISLLQDHYDYSIEPSSTPLNIDDKIYPMGKLGDIELFADVSMRWKEHVLILKNNEEVICKLHV